MPTTADSVVRVSDRPPGLHIEVARWTADECPKVPDDAAGAYDVYVYRYRNDLDSRTPTHAIWFG
jgi:hypothetical protein